MKNVCKELIKEGQREKSYTNSSLLDWLVFYI